MNLETDEDLGGAGTPAEDAQPSLRDTLVAEFAKANEPATFDADTGKEVAEGRTRDDSGRFAAKPAPADGDAAAAPAPTPAAADPAAAAADPALAAPATPADIPAPHTWTNEAKAKWNDVPPEVRKYIAEREDQVHRAITKHDEDRNFGRSMAAVFQPYQDTLREINVPPDRAVSGLLNVDNVLRKGSPEQKLEMVHEILRSYQIPLEAVTNHQPLPLDPRYGALQQHVQALEQRIAQGSQQQQEVVETRAAQAEIEAFKANAPHLEAVRPMMAQLLTGGVASGLQDAYDQAVWLHPEIRKLMLAQQTAAASTAARVGKARAAGSSISGAPTGTAPITATQKRSLRDELKANFGEATSRI